MLSYDATALRTALTDLARLRDTGTALDDLNPERALERLDALQRHSQGTGQHIVRPPVEATQGVGSVGPGRHVGDKATGTVDYFRTKKSIKLEPAMKALAEWAQGNIEAEIAQRRGCFDHHVGRAANDRPH